MDHQAFAQLLGNYGEFIGAIAVVVTLVYLALQVKQSAKQSRNNTVQALMSMEANGRFVLLNSELPSIFVRLTQGESLSDEDQVRWSSFMNGVFQHYEASYQAYLMGTMPRELMDSIDERIRNWISQPGWESQWSTTRQFMTPSFRDHVDLIVRNQA